MDVNSSNIIGLGDIYTTRAYAKKVMNDHSVERITGDATFSSILSKLEDSRYQSTSPLSYDLSSKYTSNKKLDNKVQLSGMNTAGQMCVAQINRQKKDVATTVPQSMLDKNPNSSSGCDRIREIATEFLVVTHSILWQQVMSNSGLGSSGSVDPSMKGRNSLAESLLPEVIPDIVRSTVSEQEIIEIEKEIQNKY